MPSLVKLKEKRHRILLTGLLHTSQDGQKINALPLDRYRLMSSTVVSLTPRLSLIMNGNHEVAAWWRFASLHLNQCKCRGYPTSDPLKKYLLGLRMWTEVTEGQGVTIPGRKHRFKSNGLDPCHIKLKNNDIFQRKLEGKKKEPSYLCDWFPWKGLVGKALGSNLTTVKTKQQRQHAGCLSDLDAYLEQEELWWDRLYTRLYSVSKLGKLIWESSFDNSLWHNRDLTEGILWGDSNIKFSDGLDNHFLCCDVLTGHDVPAFLSRWALKTLGFWQV